MKTKNDRTTTLVLMVLALGLFVPHSFSQTTQPGVPPTAGNFPAEGTVDTPLNKVAPSTLPSGWATKEDGHGCQWAVPGGWYFVSKNADSLRDGGGKGHASLHGAGFTGDWNAYKKQQERQFHATQVVADSTDRLWLAYSQPDGGLHYFVATLGTLFVCTAHIDVPDRSERENLTPVAKRMAMSVRPTAQ